MMITPEKKEHNRIMREMQVKNMLKLRQMMKAKPSDVVTQLLERNGLKLVKGKGIFQISLC